MNNINIRLEQSKDYRIVEEITRDAFWNLYIPGCNEHYMVAQMRKHPDFIPELAFVIELDGKIVGSIFYTHSKVIQNDGAEHKVITFGPISITPNLHRQGFGRLLITHSIIEAKKQGHRAIVIGGYPYHYEPYGFVGSKKYGISMPDGKYYVGIMALPLYDGALDGITGKIHFSPAMYPDETGLEAYDKQFPYKEKLQTDSQAEFERVSAGVDNREYH